jgi:DNA processing protein
MKSPLLHLPQLSEQRLWIEGLVERFISTDGLGLNRFRSLMKFALSDAGLDVGAVLTLLATGERSPFSKERRKGTVTWEEFVVRFAATGSLANARPTCRWWLPGDPGWNDRFADDDDAPAALSVLGDLSVLDAPRVAVVGTRSASAAGTAFARTLGRELADCGVSVISGLARGIDGAAHKGVVAGGRRIASGPVGVLGCGVHVTYPHEHRSLQQSVAEFGVLLSEVDPGRGPRTEAFPQRNRIVAQLAQVVVVVESGAKGGSLLTVGEATLRQRPVLAVPNNPMVRTAAGSNSLLRCTDGAAPLALPCHGVADVLAVVDLAQVSSPTFTEERVEPGGQASAVLSALGWDRRSTSWLADATGLSISEVVGVLNRLEHERWISHQEGRWVRSPR